MSTSSSLAASASQSIRGTTVVEAAPAPLVLQMIPSVHTQKHDQDQVQLVTTMRSLVLDQQHPIALEIAGTDQQRSLLIRARNHDDLRHVETQLHARLPHVRFVPLVGQNDPFHLSPGETVSVMELHAGQASYLPLQEFDHRNTGDDPILGILGALDALPSDLRALAQIVLVPAPPTWSQPYQRKALEHALEPERQHDRRKQMAAHYNVGAPSTVLLVIGALFLAGYFFFQYYPNLLPAWVPTTLQALLAGKWQLVLSGPHHLAVEGMIAVAVLVLLMPLVFRHLWKQLFRPPMYDMRTVAEKTSRLAYQVRLRLYVIGPGGETLQKTNVWHQLISICRTIGSSGWTTLCTSGLLILAGRWKQAAKAVLVPVVQRSKSIWQSRWARRFRIAVMLGWSGLVRFVSLVRQGQWKRAIQTTWNVFWFLVRRGWTMLTGIFVQAMVHWWQRWQEVRYQQRRRRQVLTRLIAAYRQYHIASGNYFVARRVHTHRARRWVCKGTWWKGIHHSRHLIDVEALAALWHAPANDALPDIARIAYRQSRSRLLPPSLEQTQREIPIGVSEHAGHRAPFGFPADCLESHMLIGGKSGEGKSTLMQHLALRSMKEGGGLILIDPHGDLAEHVLRLVPADRFDDVIFIDLSDEAFACGINPLDAMMAHSRDKIISDLIKIFSGLWTSWGSRMEIAFEYSLRTLYEANKGLCLQGKEGQQYTLLDIMTILTDESFCHSLLEKIEDPFIRRWWGSYYDPLSLQMQRDRVDPVLSKVAKFESLIARHIVGQSRCSIDFASCIQQQKIILIKLAKGVIGEDVARILGATLLGFLNVALEEQGKIEGAARQHFPIFIDEFQTLDGVDWGALAELRKYGAAFFLATQSLEYLREKQILPMVLANIKQLAIFRMSAEDARILHRELDVDPEDIVHLESLTCYLKLLAGRQHPTFSCTLHFPDQGDKEQAQQIRLHCQRRFMRPVSDIEVEIIERLARQIGAMPSASDQPPQKAKMEQSQERVRENSGYRGRKSQEKQIHPLASQQKVSASMGEVTTTGEITSMNWEETVGTPSSEEICKEAQEDEPGD
jgi:Helicase HerA, central domain